MELRIDDPFRFLDAGPGEMVKWLEAVKEQQIRVGIRELDRSEALDAKEQLGERVSRCLSQRAADWGMKEHPLLIVKEVKPDPKIEEDMSLREREKLQRRGQTIELRHKAKRVAELMGPPPKGSHLTREQALLEVGLTLGQVKKEVREQAVSLDPATAAILAKILNS